MDADHAEDHQYLADLELRAAVSGDPSDSRRWRVAVRVHLDRYHRLEYTRDPEGDHNRMHLEEGPADA
jgi:hypothetical protein